MINKFSAFNYIGDYCLMRKCSEQEYGVIKIHAVTNNVIKYSACKTYVNLKNKEITYAPDNHPKFLDESFAVIKPLI